MLVLWCSGIVSVVAIVSDIVLSVVVSVIDIVMSYVC